MRSWPRARAASALRAPARRRARAPRRRPGPSSGAGAAVPGSRWPRPPSPRRRGHRGGPRLRRGARSGRRARPPSAAAAARASCRRSWVRVACRRLLGAGGAGLSRCGAARARSCPTVGARSMSSMWSASFGGSSVLHLRARRADRRRRCPTSLRGSARAVRSSFSIHWWVRQAPRSVTSSPSARHSSAGRTPLGCVDERGGEPHDLAEPLDRRAAGRSGPSSARTAGRMSSVSVRPLRSRATTTASAPSSCSTRPAKTRWAHAEHLQFPVTRCYCLLQRRLRTVERPRRPSRRSPSGSSCAQRRAQPARASRGVGVVVVDDADARRSPRVASRRRSRYSAPRRAPRRQRQPEAQRAAAARTPTSARAAATARRIARSMIRARSRCEVNRTRPSFA